MPEADGIVLTPSLFKRVCRAVRIAERWASASDPDLLSDHSNAPLATFKNSSGSTIPAYGIFYDDAVSVTSNRTIVTAKQATTTFQQYYYVNGPRDVANNGYGQFQTARQVLVKYDTGSPAAGEWFGAKASQFTASKNMPGQFLCRGIKDATDKIMLAIDAGPVQTLIGKLAGSLSQGSTATVNVWAGAGGSEAVITSMTLTGRDWLMKSGATAIASGKKVVLQWINGVIYVEEAECA